MAAYGDQTRRVSSKDAILIASKLAIALHSLHTKIKDHVVLHCDLAPKNVIVEVGDSGRPSGAVLIDYGSVYARRLRQGQNVTRKIFPKQGPKGSTRCSGTNWEDYAD